RRVERGAAEGEVDRGVERKSDARDRRDRDLRDPPRASPVQLSRGRRVRIARRKAVSPAAGAAKASVRHEAVDEFLQLLEIEREYRRLVPVAVTLEDLDDRFVHVEARRPEADDALAGGILDLPAVGDNLLLLTLSREVTEIEGVGHGVVRELVARLHHAH